jgi:hypothetical protein
MEDSYFELYDRISRVGQRYAHDSKIVSAAEITKIVRRQFVSDIFRIETARDTAVSPDMIIVTGFYDCYDDSQGLPCVTIALTYSPQQDAYFTNLINWEQLAFDVAEAVGHELVHREQHHARRRLRAYKSKSMIVGEKEDQEYLGHEAEVEAYGFSIAFESWHKKIPTEVCPMFVTYAATFDQDDKVLLKLQKYISKYLKQLEASSSCVTTKN